MSTAYSWIGVVVGVYFAAVMIMCTISVIMTVLVLNFHHRRPEMYRMSPWVPYALSVVAFNQLEEASTHQSVVTHIGTVFMYLVTLTFDLLTPKWISITHDGTLFKFGAIPFLIFNFFSSIFRLLLWSFFQGINEEGLNASQTYLKLGLGQRFEFLKALRRC